MTRFLVEVTRHSGVVVCMDCGWRWPSGPDRLAGWRLAASHERRAHPGQTNAAKAFHEMKRRAAS